MVFCFSCLRRTSPEAWTSWALEPITSCSNEHWTMSSQLSSVLKCAQGNDVMTIWRYDVLTLWRYDVKDQKMFLTRKLNCHQDYINLKWITFKRIKSKFFFKQMSCQKIVEIFRKNHFTSTASFVPTIYGFKMWQVWVEF